MSSASVFSADVLRIDAARVIERITSFIRSAVTQDLRKNGVVLGLSGGIDSSVVAALCVRALGAERVLGLLMPERETSEDSTRLGRLAAEQIGIQTLLEDITAMLETAGCYRRRDEMIREVIPEYGSDYKCKIVLPDIDQQRSYRIFSVVAQAPDGRRITARLTGRSMLGIVAATNFKQRVRKMMEYFHADRLNYAVPGTPNRLEYDQGFFVKNGDGAADLKPIAHLYKTQVYQLADLLGVPDEIIQRVPTTDTYSLSQSQQEFYFSVPYAQMDLCLYGLNHGVDATDVASATGLTPQQVQRVFDDIHAKRKATRYQHTPTLLAEPIGQIAFLMS